MDSLNTLTVSRQRSILEHLPAWILTVLVFLLPLIVIPYAAASFAFGKTALAAFAVLGALVFFAIAALRHGGVVLSKSPIVLTVWLIPLTMLVAALFSPTPTLSLFGYELDSDTVAFAGVLAMVTTLAASIFTRRNAVMKTYGALLVAGWVVMLFEILQLFSHGTAFSLSIFVSPLGNLVGSWNDLAILFGLIAILSMISLVALPLSRLYRFLLALTAITSVFFLAVTNFIPVWILLAIASLGAFFYGFLRRGSRGERHISFVSLAVLLASLFFAFGGFGISSALTNYFGTAQLEARPSLESTLSVGSHIYANQSLLGTGPNLFRLAWDAYHPSEINSTPFWNVDFNAGVGIVPTAFVTAGMLGGIAWILFLGMFLVIGIRALLLSPFADEHAYYLSVSSFLAALYIMTLAVVYVPGPAMLTLGFIFVGIFVASLKNRTGAASETEVAVGRSSRVGFVAALLLVILIVAAVAGIGFVGSAYASSLRFGLATIAADRGDIDSVISNAEAANDRFAQDRTMRLIANAYVARLSNLIESTQEPTAEQQDTFRTSLAAAIENALAATKFSTADYHNWITLAGVYHAVVPLRIEGAYENAQKAYTEAQVHNPTSPLIMLNKAQLEIAKGNLTAARPLLEEAIAKKSDYTPAIFLFSQLEATAGNLPEALKRAEAATVFEPNNEILLFQLGALRLASDDYAGAKEPLERAVAVNPSYANARYFLGQTLTMLGDKQGALAQFQAVAALNPDNAQVRQIVQVLSAGEDPFATSTPKNKKPSGTRTQ